jgi:hypothetical protein
VFIVANLVIGFIALRSAALVVRSAMSRWTHVSTVRDAQSE